MALSCKYAISMVILSGLFLPLTSIFPVFLYKTLFDSTTNKISRRASFLTFATLHSCARLIYFLYWAFCNIDDDNCKSPILLKESITFNILFSVGNSLFMSSFSVNVHTFARLTDLATNHKSFFFVVTKFLLYMINGVVYLMLMVFYMRDGANSESELILVMERTFAIAFFLHGLCLLGYSTYIFVRFQHTRKMMRLLLIYSVVSFICLSTKAVVAIVEEHTGQNFSPVILVLYFAFTEAIPGAIMCVIEYQESQSEAMITRTGLSGYDSDQVPTTLESFRNFPSFQPSLTLTMTSLTKTQSVGGAPYHQLNQLSVNNT